MEFQSPQSSILDLSQSMDYINAHTNLAENSLQSHKPKGLHRPSTIHHTNLNNGGGIELNTELYQQESKKFGFSHFNSLNRASHINRRFYADGGLRNAPEEDLSRLLGLETDQFLMHWVGHLDNPVRESRTPRELKSYFHSYYENKGSSIDDFLLYMRSNPRDRKSVG